MLLGASSSSQVISVVSPKKENTYVWEGLTKSGFLESLEDFIEQVGANLKVAEKTLWDIQMAVEEAAANAQEHSYGGKKGKLRLEIEMENGEIKVKIIDWGKSIPNMNEVPEPNIVPELKNVDLEGLGMLMIRRAMDEVEFSITKNGNAVTMRKRLG